MNRRSFIRSTMAAVALTASGYGLASNKLEPAESRNLIKISWDGMEPCYLREGWNNVTNGVVDVSALVRLNENGVVVDHLHSRIPKCARVLIDVDDHLTINGIVTSETVEWA